MNIFSHQLFRKVLVVASGTAGAQLIAFLFVPIITRIYGPEIYGEFGTFLSVINIILPAVTLGYSSAIVMPRTLREASSVIHLSLIIAFILSLVCYVIIVISKSFFNFNNLENNVIYEYAFLIPLFVLFSGVHEIGNAILQRMDKFNKIAQSTFGHALVNYGGQTLVGWIYSYTITLAFIHVFSVGLKSVFIIYVSKLKLRSKPNFQRVKFVLYKYRDFALFRTPQLIINAFSQSAPVLILAFYFNSKIVGFYALARFALAIPISLLGKSVVSVFYPHFNKLYLSGKPSFSLLKNSTLNLALIGLVPFGLVFGWGNELFSIVFGSEWGEAGGFASYLSLWLFFALVNLPAVSIIPVLRCQKWYLVYELISLLLKVATLILSIIHYNDPLIAILFFSIIGIVTNSFLIFNIHMKTKEHDKVLN